MSEEKEGNSDELTKDANNSTDEGITEIKGKEEKKLARLHKRLATTLTEAISGDALEEATLRKRLRSSLGTEPENPKIIMRISKGKVTETNTGSEDDEPSRKLRKRKEEGEEDDEDKKKICLSLVQERRARARSKSLGPDDERREIRPRSRSRGAEGKSRMRKSDVENGKTVPVKDGESGRRSLETNSEWFCWTCHKPEATVPCATCPRKFHKRCVTRTPQGLCPECSAAIVAESENRGNSSKRPKLDQLCTLLTFTLERMKNVPDSEVFWKAVDPADEPLYYDYIKNPMDFNLLGKNIEKRIYGSTVAFLADAKWILHNSIIFNSNQSPLTSTARAVVKICRQMMEEIDKCPDCYLGAHTKSDWFIQVCQKPHLLVWARLKGFPFWPAKILSTNMKTQMVDARFFGAHDKAWVPVKDCFLFSKETPISGSKKKGDLESAMIEVKDHISKIREVLGSFVHAVLRTPYLPELADKQLAIMMPGWAPSPSTLRTDRKKARIRKSIDATTPNTSIPNTRPEKLSPEDQVVRDLELMAARECGTVGEIADDTSTDCEEGVKDCPEGRTPEHGYSINTSQATETSKKIDQIDTRGDKEQEITVDVAKTTQPVESETPELVASLNEPEQVTPVAVETPVEVAPQLEKVGESEKSVDSGGKDSGDTPEIGSDSSKTPEGNKKEGKPKRKRKKTSDSTTPEALNDPVAPPETLQKTMPPPATGGATIQAVTETNSADFLPVEVKQENFDQYLDEENQKESENMVKNPVFDVREPMVTIVDLNRLGARPQRERTGSTDRRKTKSAPASDGNMRLSEEVSLLVVDGEGKSPAAPIGVTPKPKKGTNKARKTIPRAPDSVTISTSSSDVGVKGAPRNLNVISVDTRNSDAQKNLLKSLCLEEKRQKKTAKDVAPETSPTSNANKAPMRDGNIMCQTKTNVTTSSQSVPSSSMNGPVFIAQNGPTFLANPQNPNLALTQNNLGQFSLVQLTNLTSGIHTNFVNMANDTIGIQNTYPTIFAANAPPPLSPFTQPGGGVLITPTSTPNATANGSPSGITNGKPDGPRTPRSGGISVKTAASLGLPPTTPPPDQITLDVQRYSGKISRMTQEALEAILRNLAEDSLPEPRMQILNAERNKMIQTHEKTVADLKKTHDRKMTELRLKLEAEKQKALSDLRSEMNDIIEDIKKKQWCALCRKEALFYCCWNTSYCDYPCQQQHWPEHMPSCAQVNHPGAVPSTAPPQAKRRFPGAPTNPSFAPITKHNENSFPTSRPNVQLNSFSPLAITTYSGPGSKKKQ